jgi:hypothetical protein
LETLQLPPGYKEDDLDDVPAEGQRIARNRDFPHIRHHRQWRHAIQAYLASIHYADAMVIDGAYHMGSFSGAVCTPSRHMIMSGRTVWRLPIGPGADDCPPDLE